MTSAMAASTSSSTGALPSPFKIPAVPNHKHRRPSLAAEDSPRLVDETAVGFRDDTLLRMSKSIPTDDTTKDEKKIRKKWSEEETQMLVNGCNKHGIGNWKSILNDPTLSFSERSPVDLKDRFRTYFPDAYKMYYPNAKTHLSSKVRATNPDGSSLFAKTRSKKRRPFTEEEDRALREGYEAHGCIWATIVKDPIFVASGRRSTDLRDRFRNAFPEEYQRAGYKPRGSAKLKKLSQNPVKTEPQPLREPGPMRRSATDDQVLLNSSSAAGPVRRRRRAHTSQGLLGSRSVPPSAAATDVDTDVDDSEDLDRFAFHRPSSPSQPPPISPPAAPPLQWTSSGVDTPTHPSSPVIPQQPQMMIGKSAWAEDWLFSSNPRLQSSSVSSISSASASSYSVALPHDASGELSPPPSASVSPFSFNASLSGSNIHSSNTYAVMDRYDLFPSNHHLHLQQNFHTIHEYTSDIGIPDAHDSFFSDSNDEPGAGGMRGFTHHSFSAGDLMVGARTHQPLQTFNPLYPGFGFSGLGLTGVNARESTIPLGVMTPSLPLEGIDEIELAGISLEDQHTEDADMEDGTGGINGAAPPATAKAGDREKHCRPSSSTSDGLLDDDCLPFDELVSLPPFEEEPSSGSIPTLSHSTPIPVSTTSAANDSAAMGQETPPGTPHPPPRNIRHASFTQHHSHLGGGNGGRSMSQPPSEARQPLPTRRDSQPNLLHAPHSQPNMWPTAAASASPVHTQQSENGIPFLDLQYTWNLSSPSVYLTQHGLPAPPPTAPQHYATPPNSFPLQPTYSYPSFHQHALDLAGHSQSFSEAAEKLAFHHPTSEMLNGGSSWEPPRSVTPSPGRSGLSGRPMSMTMPSPNPGIKTIWGHSRGLSHSALSSLANDSSGGVNPKDLMMLSSGGEDEATRRRRGGTKRNSWDGR
ncbi:hypothetical protein DL96DRAFT_1746422 [Flagelloscypha sp. PMI_526]|nr:hypothetical protein DL96DRAFT_1746422 [Flagelloscypha sp. PMI_526]